MLPRPRIAVVAVLAVFLFLAAPPLVASSQQQLRGPDGEVLPFADDEEILEFLRTADIVAREHIDIGINGIDRLTLEKDGLRLRAGFREVVVRREGLRVGDEVYLVFLDSYAFECAAYRLARRLGIDNVPPATLRTVGNTPGSIQLWVEGALESLEDATPRGVDWAKQLWTMTFFDSLVYNVDRNPGNVLIDQNQRLWMIDHTRAFQLKEAPFQIERVDRVARDVWDRLIAMERADFDEVFAGLLDSSQVTALMKRRETLIARIRALSAERGEGAVFYRE